jgi:uncharacterized membrane protein
VQYLTNFENFQENNRIFVACIYSLPPGVDWEDHCSLESGQTPYPTLVIFHIGMVIFPVVFFFLICFRRSLLEFWKEYLLYMWSTKTIVLQFHMSVDSGSTAEAVSESHNELAEQIREL